MGLYDCRSGVVCTKPPLFYSPVSCSGCAVGHIEDMGDQNLTPRSRSAAPVPTIFLPRNRYGQDGGEVQTTQLDSEAAKRCQWFLAAPSPHFFHRSHFVLGPLLGSGCQMPVGSIRHKGLSAQAGCAICLPNLFTYNILTGRKSLFSSDIGSREALPIVLCRSVGNSFSPSAF